MSDDQREFLFLSAIEKRDAEIERVKHMLAVAVRKIRRDTATIKELRGENP